MRVIVSGPSKWKRKVAKEEEKGEKVRLWIKTQLDSLVSEKDEVVEAGSSLHLGLDSMFASEVLLKGIALKSFIVSKDQDRFWEEGEKERFKNFLELSAETTQICDEHYEKGCIQKQSDLLTDWVLEKDQPILLLVRERSLSKLQKTRVQRVQDAKGQIRFFKW